MIALSDSLSLVPLTITATRANTLFLSFSCFTSSVLDVCVQDSTECFVSNLDDVMMLFLVLYCTRVLST